MEMRDSEGGKWNTECGTRNADRGTRNAERRMQNAEQTTAFEVRNGHFF